MANKLVTVARFEIEPTASLCRILLERAGVSAYLSEDNAIAAHWGLSNALGGVKVEVNEADLEKALEALREGRADFGEEKGAALGEVSVTCESCKGCVAFPGSARGSVQECPECQEYLDVPE
ncbi:MAG: putative signal transducing protein [Planctomycetota bacterium]|jgi:hypothetical protein